MSQQEFYGIISGTRKLFIRGFKVNCSIGVYEHEKKQTQNVIFDCDIWINLENSTSQTDSIDDVLDYTKLIELIETTAKSRHFELQETLIDAISNKLSKLKGIRLARISCYKPEINPEVVQGIGVENFIIPK